MHNNGSNPQAGPATALAQLLTEHPELPTIRWNLVPSGGLYGAFVEDGVDVRPVLAAYAAVLGGEPDRHFYTAPGAEVEKFSSELVVAWRDITFRIVGICDAAALVQAVAA